MVERLADMPKHTQKHAHTYRHVHMCDKEEHEGQLYWV